MINAIHLVWIVPLTATITICVMAPFKGGKGE